ncbi:myosin-7-like [Bombus pyrosoma]|uniref:myosin-7-like n=1 Tax=Bombus pyrosoma TaxID=396416 RepID=UPI001CB894D1|nr:myosin-7-like [Bombus pyrosoma]
MPEYIDISDLLDKLNNCEDIVADLRKQLEERDEQIDTLNKGLESMVSQKGSLEQTEATKEQLRREDDKRELLNELNKLREAPKYRDDGITDLPERRNKLEKDYKNKTTELQSKLDQTNDEIDELKAEITKLKNELEECKKRNAELEERCLDKHRDEENLPNELDEARKQVEVLLTGRLENERAARTALPKELQRNRDEIEKLQTEIFGLKEDGRREEGEGQTSRSVASIGRRERKVKGSARVAEERERRSDGKDEGARQFE